MKKYILLSLTFAAFTISNAKDITGKVYCNENGIANVVVTDGTNFTVTDKNGRYNLKTPDNADFVYIVTPSGYITSYSSGTPCFYKALNGKNFDFELFEYGVKEGRYTLFAMGDTQPGN